MVGIEVQPDFGTWRAYLRASLSNMESDKQNIFIIGADEFNYMQLKNLPNAQHVTYHELLSMDELKEYGKLSFEGLLSKSREKLRSHDGTIDGIITHWDFPATLLQTVLTDELDLPGPRLTPCLQCEHKYWFRHTQREIGQEDCRFQAINPFMAEPARQVELAYPFWLKPVKATESMLSFLIDSEEEFNRAIEEVRANIEIVARPFNEVLERIQLPDEIASVDGFWCNAESPLMGSQHTVSGFLHKGKAHPYGVVDSPNYDQSSSFQCYIYPSDLPESVQSRMREKTVALMEHIDLGECAFNIEYFYDRQTGEVRSLEANPRVSQSHSDLYRRVDGASNQKLALELACGEEPGKPYREGSYKMAAKFFYRVFKDAFVKQLPPDREVCALEDRYDAFILIKPDEGQRLSEMIEHDSASYVLAEIFIGGSSREDLQNTYDAIVDGLDFELE